MYIYICNGNIFLRNLFYYALYKKHNINFKFENVHLYSVYIV